jgi:hypothetical protein
VNADRIICRYCGEVITGDGIWSRKGKCWVHPLCEAEVDVMAATDTAEKILAAIMGDEPHRPPAVTRGGGQIPPDDGWEKEFLSRFGIDWRTGKGK